MILLDWWTLRKLVCLCIVYMTIAMPGDNSVIGILLLVSNSSQYNSTESISVVQDALEEVNQRTDMLPNITLELSTVVESTVSVDKLNLNTVLNQPWRCSMP